jgi:hypothetical protein
MFDLGDMDRFIQAFDVTPKPKLVINLFPSFATHIASQPFMHHWSGLKGDFGDHHFHCEVDKRSLHETDRKIGMFLKKCEASTHHPFPIFLLNARSLLTTIFFNTKGILPVAIQTNAMVILHNINCSLSNAFSDMARAEAAKVSTNAVS